MNNAGPNFNVSEQEKFLIPFKQLQMIKWFSNGITLLFRLGATEINEKLYMSSFIHIAIQ